MRDLMTEGEIEEFARRLKAAELLASKMPYSQITKETGFSSTTIARISKWLNDGTGGYQLMIDRLHHHGSPPLGKGSN
jgi:TrpR-related protein YerC/YecD